MCVDFQNVWLSINLRNQTYVRTESGVIAVLTIVQQVEVRQTRAKVVTLRFGVTVEFTITFLNDECILHVSKELRKSCEEQQNTQ